MPNDSTARNIDFQPSDIRRASIANHISVLTDIYKEDVNIAVWQNQLPEAVLADVDAIMIESKRLQVKVSVTPTDVIEELLASAYQLKEQKALCDYIKLLVDMFCTLFEIKNVGLRLAILDQAMCPKFHVDKIPCRLVTTLSGIGTQWLPEDQVDRSKLGIGSLGLPDSTSGIMRNQTSIKNMSVGDVSLLKGEGWYNNENNGAVHRSPALSSNERRLLLTLDFID